MFDQVTIDLARAKDNYRSSLRAIDSRLRQIVSKDPSQLAAARVIQATYGEDLAGADLAASEQPAAAAAGVTEKPKRARKAAAAKPKTKAKK